MPNDYHTQTELERTRRLRELLHELPPMAVRITLLQSNSRPVRLPA